MNEPKARVIQANGLRFSVLEWEPATEERGLVVASHGFPDHAWTFRHLGPRLARAGLRVAAPFLRGYAPTEVSNGPFHPLAIAQDLEALARTLRVDRKPLFLIGHDWGASASYLAAAALGDELERLVTLAVPRGPGFLKALVSDPEQQRRSWYMFFFQMAFAEQAVAHDDFAFIDRLWREWSPTYSVPPEDMRSLKDTLGAEGVLRAALSYYRDTFLRETDSPPSLDQGLIDFASRTKGPISAPTLYLHGVLDGCIGADLAAAPVEGFSGSYQCMILDDVGHFLHLEAPETVGDLISSFLEDGL